MPPELHRPLAALLGAATLSACGQPDCATLARGMDQDLCWFETVQERDDLDVAGLLAVARKVEDPVVRSATVMHWIRRHPEADASATPLCDLLSYSEQISCRRRLESPHLRR